MVSTNGLYLYRQPLEAPLVVPKFPVSAREMAVLQELLHNPPPQADSGLDPEPYGHFVAETQQIAEACLDLPRLALLPLVARVVQLGVDKQYGAGTEWRPVEMVDSNRMIEEGRIFGIAPTGPQSQEQFVSIWQVEHRTTGEHRKVQFAIDVQPDRESSWILEPAISAAEERIMRLQLEKRGPRPWEIQVACESPLGQWVQELGGTFRLGQIKGELSQGPLAGAVRRGCDDLGLSGELLPRMRGVPATKPWQTGCFLRPWREDLMLWEGYAQNGSSELVLAAIGVRLEVIGFKEIS